MLPNSPLCIDYPPSAVVTVKSNKRNLSLAVINIFDGLTVDNICSVTNNAKTAKSRACKIMSEIWGDPGLTRPKVAPIPRTNSIRSVFLI